MTDDWDIARNGISCAISSDEEYAAMDALLRLEEKMRQLTERASLFERANDTSIGLADGLAGRVEIAEERLELAEGILLRLIAEGCWASPPTHTYFGVDGSVHDLTVTETAYVAALVSKLPDVS